MNTKSLFAAGLLAACASGAGAVTVVNVYNTAGFDQTSPGNVELLGFGRGTSSIVASAAAKSSQHALDTVSFFDTWNLDVSGVTPGLYSFNSLVVDAVGSLTFSSLTFNSYDNQGVRHTILFDLNATGTEAIASGTFTVRSSCPVASCVWIDVSGTQASSGLAGYGGTVTAALVPEPESYALMALGLGVLGLLARKRKAT